MGKRSVYITLAVGPNCNLEAIALRSVLEYFGARVTLHYIGRPNDFISVLSGNELEGKCDYLILSTHGDEGRFCMPILGDEVYELDEPRGTYFTLEDVARYTNLKDIQVLTTGCTLGDDKLAEAFLSSGCDTYIGPSDYIDGNSAFMFVTRFFYELIQNKRNQQEAFDIAKSIDEETLLYHKYRK